MAPISPADSLKRSNSSQSGDDMDEPSSKRRRIEGDQVQKRDAHEPSQTDYTPQTPPPELDDGPEVVQEPSFNDDPKHLLLRSIALALRHVGFESAKPEAMEAMCSQVETYATRFLSQITTSMINSRRSQPIPADFEYALYKFDLPLASLRPHLNPPIPVSVTQIQMEAVPAEDEEMKKQKEKTIASLLGEGLNGASDMKDKPYIPSNFPPFPSTHTWKETPREMPNHRDKRKIREEAAKVSRQAEEALRRFVNSAKSTKEKDLKIAIKDPITKRTCELWEGLIGDLMANQTGSVVHKDEDKSMIVNSEKKYARKAVPPKKKSATIPELQF